MRQPGFLVSLKTILVDFARNVVAWAPRQYVRWLLFAPVATIVVVHALSRADAFGWHESSNCKAFMEVVHPSILAAAVLVGGMGFLLTRDPALAFVSGIAAFPLGRELAGQGHSYIMIAGVLTLIVTGDRYRSDIGAFLRSRWALSFVATCFVCYLVSQLYDRGIVKRLGWLVTLDTSWEPSYASNIEETLETVGGSFLLLASLAVWLRVRAEQRSRAA